MFAKLIHLFICDYSMQIIMEMGLENSLNDAFVTYRIYLHYIIEYDIVTLNLFYLIFQVGLVNHHHPQLDLIQIHLFTIKRISSTHDLMIILLLFAFWGQVQAFILINSKLFLHLLYRIITLCRNNIENMRSKVYFTNFILFNYCVIASSWKNWFPC